MDFFNNDSQGHSDNKKYESVDEVQHIRVRSLEVKNKFKFDPWMHALAMKISEPVKVYAWMVQSKRYKIEWNHETRTLNFIDMTESERQFAKFGMKGVKNYLGNDIFDHFGKINYAINGVIQ